ncbi:hypothetical protein [Nesterenkonia alkaliphila]|uniref:hypothetical protein n=1 Tax=Nesterenkonia alkaliphila TaxID=1463631 RepID=UPI0016633DED|nr:hypothetical protein [Nesterenkonia alkaliphila]GFZ96177.1 hypothetical protein GCM10011359_27020 [Nesterenkonia alkaliphila]
MRRIPVTLSDEAAQALDQAVADGQFRSPDEAVNLSILDALADADQIVRSAEFVRFLNEVAIPAGERLKSDPSRGLSVEEVRSRFEQKRRERERERQAA